MGYCTAQCNVEDSRNGGVCDLLYRARWKSVEGAWGSVDERSAHRYRKRQGYRSVYRQDDCESSVPVAAFLWLAEIADQPLVCSAWPSVPKPSPSGGVEFWPSGALVQGLPFWSDAKFYVTLAVYNQTHRKYLTTPQGVRPY